MNVNEMAPGWTERIEAAQTETHMRTPEGMYFARRRYGTEGAALTAPVRCRDCAVERGQLHVRTCCIERCPVCIAGQAISCGCLESAEPATAQ